MVQDILLTTRDGADPYRAGEKMMPPGASDLVSYLIVNKNDKEKSVREIYNAFF